MILLPLLMVSIAQAITPAELGALFCPLAKKLNEKKFEQEYVEHGGVEEVKKLLLDNQKQFGKCLEVRSLGDGTAFEIDYKEAVLPLEILLEGGGKIKNVFLGMPRLKNDSPAKVMADLKKFPWASSFYVALEGGKEQLAFQAEKALNVSRSNQLFLLRGVQESGLKLSELVPLEEKRFVRTFGLIHFWKPGTLLTVDTLLNLLVAEKDLTASDLLLNRLGAGVVAKGGQKLSPFLSYREYFQLATREKSELDTKEKILKLLPSLAESSAPQELRMDRIDLVGHLGWFATAKELCETALQVKEDLLARNSRLNAEYLAIQPRELDKFGVIQTRDSGISQLTAVFRVKGAEKWHCVALTANHGDEIEEGSFASIGARLTNLAVGQPR